MPSFEPTWFLSQEARALATRLDRVKPFVLQETMVPAAALLPDAQVGIERALANGRSELRRRLDRFIRWVEGPGREASADVAQRRFTNLRMAFNAHLSELEVFSDAITQRSESELGVWLSGLDVAAADGLMTPGGHFYDPPPIICYVDRGHGAAIRRIHTRLPAGSRNPVGIIRIPRERMVGHGIASSLLHEVGHQGAALLDLVASLRAELNARRARAQNQSEKLAWYCWSTWISEIAADFWSVAKLGIGSTLGLVGVVSLPRWHVFRVTLRDPHPFPWIRVKVSAAIGQLLYPHAQWGQLETLWEELYPRGQAPVPAQKVIAALEPAIPKLARVLADHRPSLLQGVTLGDAVRSELRTPSQLLAWFVRWQRQPSVSHTMPPTLFLAVLGQARLAGRLTPVEETAQVSRVLAYWAMRSTVDVAAASAAVVRQNMPIEQPAFQINEQEVNSYA
jgi:hypothetical protein